MSREATTRSDGDGPSQAGGGPARAVEGATVCTYLLTIRRVRFDAREAEGFAEYFRLLADAGCEVLVVDGSPPEVFASHAGAWRGHVRHAPVDPQYKYLNGKVNGIHTGVALAACERIILADDDIRYTAADVRRMSHLLEAFEMIRPQNYLRPLPPWARTEAARMLVNRAWIKEGDYPGTLGVRRGAMLRVGHYDGDVLFDNEEIVRHFRARGATVCYARDFFIWKRPPSLRKWFEQRPRQAYEDFVMRAKTVFFAALPFALAALWLAFGWRGALGFVLSVAVGSALLAARGLGDGGARFFPAWVCAYAPLWVAERTLSTYWAFYWRVARGGYPFGDRLLSKGTGRDWTTPGPAATGAQTKH
ncbi:MAG TPA: glycosyltransferase family 2 protein [Pyrinomonadaceae bacterium]|nr:glycosyltransferase family 2 protein [Pyrinomonadaceae bacterium]